MSETRTHPSGIDDPNERKRLRRRALERGDTHGAKLYAELPGRPRGQEGQRSTDPRRTKAVTLFTQAEYDACLARAAQLGISYSEWSRRLLLADVAPPSKG